MSINQYLYVGYLEQGLMVTDPNKLRLHYWKSITSKLDVITGLY